MSQVRWLFVSIPDFCPLSYFHINWPSDFTVKCLRNLITPTLAERRNVNHDLRWLPLVMVSLG